MKTKKLLSVLLAAVMAFSLLCSPAFAAGKADTLADINDNDSIWVGVQNLDSLKKTFTLSYRYWDSNDGVITRDEEASEPGSWNAYELPLGVTLAAGPNNKLLKDIWVFSDPDGDGVYDERLLKITYDGNGDYVSDEVVPVTSAGPITPASTEDYANTFNWGFGPNFFSASLKGTPGYHTLTTDYLVKMFGANTLMIFWDEAEEDCVSFLLSGKEAPAGVLYPLEDQGVYLSTCGDVVSGWAVDPVNNAINKGLFPEILETAHNYDLTGSITRAEFATLVMYLYGALANTNEFTRPSESPFVDVNESNPHYKYILGAYHLGIVNGTSTVNKTFSPNALVKRQDAAAVLARVYEKVGGKIPAVSSTSFSDNGQIKDYAKNAVAFMSSKSIINGVGGNRFNPDGNASVEQALKIAVYMLNSLNV